MTETSAADHSRLHEFLRAIDALKRTRRAGWVREGVRDAESVADHSWGVALLALLLPLPVDVDRDRLVALAVIHDLAEARVGDLVPGAIDPAEKHRREAAAIAALAALLPADSADRLVGLWAEYEAGVTPAARLAKDLDRLEMLLQADAYAAAGNPGPMPSFWQSERNRIADPEFARFQRWLEGRG